MDSLTHILLGGAIAQACFVRRLGKWAIIVGGLAATLPDLDVFIRTGDAVLDHALHRSFMHSFLIVPLLGVIAAVPFAARRRLHHLWRPMLIAGLLAALSHGLLDACTSYGTQLLWPFSYQRVAWDTIAIVDPIFTGILLIGVIVAARRASAGAARIALALAAAYLALGAIQHERALTAQSQIAAARHETIDRGRAIPTLGNIVAWRSLYQTGDSLHADALRVGFAGVARVGAGETTPLIPADGLASAPAVQHDVDLFYAFSDGYVARVPGRPEILGDMRYSLTSGTFSPFWGIQLPASGDASPQWTGLNRRAGSNLTRIWENLWGTDGTYAPVREGP